MALSMSGTLPTPRSTARIASSRYGTSSRLTMKPELSFAEPRRERERALERLFRRRHRADDLDERHERHRIEEVQSDESIGALGGAGHLGDREARGVGREDRSRAAQPVELHEQGVLESQGFRMRRA